MIRPVFGQISGQGFGYELRRSRATHKDATELPDVPATTPFIIGALLFLHILVLLIPTHKSALRITSSV